MLQRVSLTCKALLVLAVERSCVKACSYAYRVLSELALINSMFFVLSGGTGQPSLKSLHVAGLNGL